MMPVQCEDIRSRLWDLVDGALDESARAEMEAHLASCEACRRALAERRRVWDALDLDTVPAAPDLTQRILNRAMSAPRRRIVGSWIRWAGAAAAVALLAVGLTLLLRPAPDAPPAPVIAELPAPYIETELVSVEAVTDIELLMYGDLIEAPIETLVEKEIPISGI